jgi:hypothetical protein
MNLTVQPKLGAKDRRSDARIRRIPLSPETNKSGNVRQRSLNLDDHTYKLLTDFAEKRGLTASAANRMLLREALSTGLEHLEGQAVQVIADDARVPEVPRRGKTILPPDSTSSFKVEGEHVRQRHSRRDNVLSERPEK